MNTVKKVLGLVTTALTLLALPPVYAMEEGELVVWINGDKGYNGLQKVGDRFAKDTGVAVTVEHPEDATKKFQQAAAAGKGPDIWIWAHDRIGEWIDGGLLSPIEPNDKVKAKFEDAGWDAFTYKGRIWGFPINFEAVGLIYNKDLVAEPPASFEEVIALDKRLASQGKKAILWDYNNTYFTWGLLAANGGYAFGQDANGYVASDVGVNNAGAVQGVEMLTKLIDEDVMPRGASYADMESGVNKGEIAMMISGPWAWSNLKKSGINFGVAPIPSIGGKPGSPFIGVLGAMINHASPNKDIAMEFMENYMMTPDGLKEIDADVPLGAVAHKELYKEMSADEHIKGTMSNVKLGKPMPFNAEMGRFWSAMASALENVTQGRQKPKEALDAAQQRILSSTE